MKAKRKRPQIDAEAAIQTLMEHGYTQSDVARTLAVRVQTVWAWAHGNMQPGPKNSAMLARLVRLVLAADERMMAEHDNDKS